MWQQGEVRREGSCAKKETGSGEGEAWRNGGKERGADLRVSVALALGVLPALAHVHALCRLGRPVVVNVPSLLVAVASYVGLVRRRFLYFDLCERPTTDKS